MSFIFSFLPDNLTRQQTLQQQVARPAEVLDSALERENLLGGGTEAYF